MGKKTGMPRGRPTKMKEWNEALRKVLEQRKIIFLSDDDLVLLVNQELKKSGHGDKTIVPRQFRRWKSGEAENGHAQEFLELLQLAYIEMKDAVGEKLMSDGNFTRWAWILERKFSNEFALVHKSENLNRQETVIQIDVGSEFKRNLIEAIRNDDTIIPYTEVEPVKIEATSSTDNKKEDEYDF